MLQVIRWLKGYLAIKVFGYSPERFMNLCSNHDILLWNIKNCGDYYSMCISLKGFFQLKSIARKTKTRVAVTNRYGLPFLSVRMRRRKIFIAGFLGSIGFWILMSGFIWNIELQGNFYVTEDVFFDFLWEGGVRSGMKKKEVDIEALEKSIRNEFDIVTWTSAKIDGTRLIIQIKENDLIAQKEPEPEKEKGGEAAGYDLVAAKDGTVISIVTRRGVPLVAEGAEVKKGDILVEGSIPIYQEDATVKRYEYCVSDADILIKSRLSFTEEIKEKYRKKIYTGREKNRSFLMLGEFRLERPFFSRSFQRFDRLEEKKQVCLFDSLYLPVYYGKTSVREYEEAERIYTKEEIKGQFEEKVQKFMQTLEEKGVQIIEKNVTINKNKGTWKMKADFTVSEKAVMLKETEKRPSEDREAAEQEPEA